MSFEEINDKIKKVPPQLVPEIIDYIDFLMNKYGKTSKRKRPFKFTWQGGLSDISKEYSSVELQHKVTDWREWG